MTDDRSTRPPVQSPRLAELVANLLRDRILRGELADGSMLPRQQDLMDEFRVSVPSVREAIRILESEGMITVVRGKVGGAIVHSAPVHTAAYTMAMVLQARGVKLSEVAETLEAIEPMCAGMCAARDDRDVAVVPELRRVHQQLLDARGDLSDLSVAGREFHEALVEQCGSKTMIVLVGALEAIWSAHAADLAQASQQGELPEGDELFSDDALDQYAAAHARIIDAIAAGDAEAASARATEHLEQSAAPSHTDHVVQARVVRSRRNATPSEMASSAQRLDPSPRRKRRGA